VKICGITRPDDAVLAEDLGADAVGVVVESDSPRSVPLETAGEIFDRLGPFITTVCVSHTREDRVLRRIIDLRPDAIQVFFPFPRPPGRAPRIIRVISPTDSLPGDCDALIVDASHGSGRLYDPGFARSVVARSAVPVILAGGLSAENVANAIREIRPFGVDVASGVERRPGEKDPALLAGFFRAVRGCGTDG
jgi:phosphoribosylanthranilate isomerase